MNVHHLELFYYVARHGGISQAVRHIPYGIQQPAVSGQCSRWKKPSARGCSSAALRADARRAAAGGIHHAVFREPRRGGRRTARRGGPAPAARRQRAGVARPRARPAQELHQQVPSCGCACRRPIRPRPKRFCTGRRSTWPSPSSPTGPPPASRRTRCSSCRSCCWCGRIRR